MLQMWLKKEKKKQSEPLVEGASLGLDLGRAGCPPAGLWA